MRTLLTALIAVTLAFAQPKGGIVFSSAPIDPANPQNLTTTFKTGDPIYAAVLLSAPVKSLCAGRVSNNATHETLDLKHFIDGNFADTGRLQVKGPFFDTAKAFRLDVAPAPESLSSYLDPNLVFNAFGQMKDGPIKWSTDLGKLPPGPHKFKIEIDACSEPAAAGEFSISGPSFAHYAAIVPALQNRQTATNKMAQPKMRNPALEAAMLASMKASPSQAWKDQILRIVIIDPDWFIERHPISGAILFRYLRAQVAVKNPAGACSFYQLTTFKQHYVSGRFGPTTYDGHGDRTPLPCSSVQ